MRAQLVVVPERANEEQELPDPDAPRDHSLRGTQGS